MRVLRRLGGLSRTERLLLLRALAGVTTVRLALWLFPFSAVWRRSLAAGRSRPDQATDRPGSYEAAAWAVRAAARYVPGASCLTQSLALCSILQRKGISCELRLGVIKSADGQLSAHAWVERDGKPLVSSDDVVSYSPFPVLDGSPR